MKEIAHPLMLAIACGGNARRLWKSAGTLTGKLKAITLQPTTTPAPEQAAAEPLGDPDKKLNLFCWSEYVPQEIIDAFTKETGINVSVESYASNDWKCSPSFSPAAEIMTSIQPSEYVIEGLIKENLLAPIDHAAIPNIKNLAPEFTNMSFDPGNKFSIPYMAGTVGIVIGTLSSSRMKSRATTMSSKASSAKYHRRSRRCARNRGLGL